MKTLQKISRFCADIIYPNRCPCCDGFIMWNKYLCDECEKKVLIDTGELCPKCGKRQDECICINLLEYDQAFAISYYENETKNALLDLKRALSKNFGLFAGERLGNLIKADANWLSFDGIVPVPMEKYQRLARGYNQAEIIAESISEVTGIPVMKNCIIKEKGYKPQHTLNAEEREKNVLCFNSGKRRLDGMSLIICDDILTTGSTLNRCAQILKSCGAKTVCVAVASTVRRKNDEDLKSKDFEIDKTE